MPLHPEIVLWLERETGIALDPASARSVGGGCIHTALLVGRRDGGRVFLKLADGADEGAASVLAAERRGLELLGAAGAIRVPKPYAGGVAGGCAVLAMEGLELRGGAGEGEWARLAERLAALHEVLSPDGRHGAPFDNFIGATPQPNAWCADWAEFFVVRRLEPQFALAADRGRRFADVGRLLDRVHRHLAPLRTAPSLLHGDLWGGNAAFLADGEPVLYDPAVYYGDRETDLAFTKLFGGFGPAFHRRYRELAPAPEPVRETIYNLYHLLNHDHLFGGGYGVQAEGAMRSILRELG